MLLSIVLLSAWLAWSEANTTDRGPGGPVLVVTSTANPFTKYYAEMLRAEGLNAFTVMDISGLSKQPLDAFDVLILGEMILTPGQVTGIEDYVKKGGNLIAMRPDRKLAGLLGLTPTSSAVAEKYLLLNDVVESNGIVREPIQFHGAADTYDIADATSLATLYSSNETATTYPAITLRHVEKGQAAAFAFDLARSIVYTLRAIPIGRASCATPIQAA